MRIFIICPHICKIVIKPLQWKGWYKIHFFYIQYYKVKKQPTQLDTNPNGTPANLNLSLTFLHDEVLMLPWFLFFFRKFINHAIH